MSSDEIADKIAAETAKLKRRSIAMHDYIKKEDNKIIDDLIEKTDENKERLNANQNKLML